MPVHIARLAKLLGAPVHQATFEQVAALIAKKACEDADLDFKRSNRYVDGDGAEELAKDVSAMANTRGGLIIIGIEEDGQACAKAVTLVTVSDKITGPDGEYSPLPRRPLYRRDRNPASRITRRSRDGFLPDQRSPKSSGPACSPQRGRF
jgi:hypothetical protein